ncbi:uncharacterized protein BDV14DRAFT_199579 [Aspergillus stella-maris]|uniref:uncharacterized protein n=1 Tax=Aspergillus stella-maris TaxID=1810926 RepID=UPI003CCDF897
MDRLPVKILSLIMENIRYQEPPYYGHYPESKLAPYVTISRQWQAIVEPIIWRKIKIWKPGSMDLLRQYTSGDAYRCARPTYIEYLNWSAASLVNRGSLYAITQWDLNVHQKVFPDWITGQHQKLLSELFHLLKTWEDVKSRMKLAINLADCHSAYSHGSKRWSDLEWDEWKSSTLDQLWQKGQYNYCLDLNDDLVRSFPVIPYITIFKLPDAGTRSATFFRLLTRFPNVRDVRGGEGYDIPSRAYVALQEQRQGIVDNLLLLPESVDSFKYEIDYQREMSYNPTHDAANYLDPQGLDEFSIAFRSVSMSLRKLELSHVRVSSALFWPGPHEKVDTESLFWPNLEELLVQFVPPFAADGKWLLDNDLQKWSATKVEEPDQPWDYEDGYSYRDILRSTEGNELFASIGLAAQRMPRLRDLGFSLRPEHNEGDATQELTFTRDLVTGNSRLEIKTGIPDYDVGENVTSAWRLNGEKAKKFREWSTIELDKWP